MNHCHKCGSPAKMQWERDIEGDGWALRLGNFCLTVITDEDRWTHGVFWITEIVTDWTGETFRIPVDFKMTEASREALQEMALASLASVVKKRLEGYETLKVLLEVCR